MHKIIASIILLMVSFFAKAQNYQTITRVVYEQQRISGYNSLNKLAVQVDCKDMVWQVLPDNSIKIWDDIHSFTVFSAKLSMPSFTALGDSLRAWQVSCSHSGITFPTNLDTSFRLLDSIYQELKDVDTLCFTGDIVVSERPQAAQFGVVADLVTSHTTSSAIPTASTLEVIVENIGTASTTITYQGISMPLAANQQRYFYAIWDEARRIYSPIGTLVVNGTATATIVVTRKNPQ